MSTRDWATAVRPTVSSSGGGKYDLICLERDFHVRKILEKRQVYKLNANLKMKENRNTRNPNIIRKYKLMNLFNTIASPENQNILPKCCSLKIKQPQDNLKSFGFPIFWKTNTSFPTIESIKMYNVKMMMK